METNTDKELFLKLRNGNEPAFEELFNKYYASLCLFALQFLHDHAMAEEIVQGIFVKIWSKRKQLEIGSSVKNYLFFSVRNQCFNLLEHEKVEKRHVRQNLSAPTDQPDPDSCFLEIGLMQRIEQSISLLPEKRREIFMLSRQHGLKYHEIAVRLNISIKTVEAQMGLALKQLREMLKDYRDLM